jgi:hypothetical protein
MGAGILPVTLYKGGLFLLVGQEKYNHLWSDFGGKSNKGEKVIKTAIREGGEELNGLLGINDELENKVLSNIILSISYDHNNYKYTTLVFKTYFDPQLPIYFDNINKFAETHLQDKINNNHNGLFEKSEIKWIKISTLKNKKIKATFRPWYIPILNCIIDKEEFIISEINNNPKMTKTVNKKAQDALELL